MVMEVRHSQIAQQNAAIGVRVGADPPLALGCQLGQFRHQPAVLIEQLLGLIAFHPAFELLEVFGMIGIHEQWHLVRPEGALDRQAVDFLRPGRLSGDLRTIIGQRGRMAVSLLRAFLWICLMSSMASSMIAAIR